MRSPPCFSVSLYVGLCLLPFVNNTICPKDVLRPGYNFHVPFLPSDVSSFAHLNTGSEVPLTALKVSDGSHSYNSEHSSNYRESQVRDILEY